MSLLQTMERARGKVIDIPVKESNSMCEINAANSGVTHVMRKRTSAELTYWGVPDHKSSVLRRRVRLVRREKKGLPPEAMYDMPDLDDLHFSWMPWISNVTFQGGPRPFRGKYIFGAAMEIVIAFDEMLYTLRIDSDKLYPDEGLHVVSLYRAGPLENHHSLVISKATDRQLEGLSDIPDVHPKLEEELISLGYVRDGSVFTHPDAPSQEYRLVCKPFGKLVIFNHSGEVTNFG